MSENIITNEENNAEEKKQNKKSMKLCRHCRSEIDRKAKVCPVCHKSQTRGKGCLIFLIIIAAIIALPIILLGSCSYGVKKAVDEAEKDAQARAVTANQLIYDQDGIKVYYTGMEVGAITESFKIKLLVENNTDNSIMVQVEDFSVDGFSIAEYGIIDVAKGTKTNDDFTILHSDMEKNGLDYDTIKKCKLSFHFTNKDKLLDSIDTDVITFDLR